MMGNIITQTTHAFRSGSLRPGWYRVRLQVEESSIGGNCQLNLGMPDVPGYLSQIHLPLSDSDQVIDAIFWLRSQSNSLTVLNPVGEPASLESCIKLTRLNCLSALIRMALQLTSKNDQQLTAIIGKNTARFRKKGFDGMMLRIYKDYYKATLGSYNTQDNTYEKWVRRYDDLTDIKRHEFHLRAQPLLAYGVRISIIMPVYDPSPEHLEKAIQSVIHQIYGNWELCIVDDHSNNPKIKNLLKRLAKQDQRIKLKRLRRNGGISVASNVALKMASGRYITFLDHDDLLREHSLLRIAEECHQNPEIRLLYTDEDKINTDGNRQDPHFKPDWNPELLRSVNYICHLAVYDKQLLIEIGGLISEHDGAQDYDLILRATEQLDEQQIAHLPEILYHWRITSQSTASDPNNKQYAAKAGKTAVEKSLLRAGSGGSVSHGKHATTYQVSYPLPVSLPLVSIIIPTRNSHALVAQCIDSIRKKTNYRNYEIIVVDNGSTNLDSLDYFQSLEAKKLARIVRLDIPFNYSTLNNFGVKQSKGEIVALVNNDIEVINSEWLSEMVSLVIQPKTGAVGAKLYYSDLTLQHGGVILGVGGVAGHSHKYFPRHVSGYFGRLVHRQNLSAVTAACLVVRKKVYLEVGGLDAKNLAVAFNDVDFCLRLGDAGYRNIWTPHAELYHHESISRGSEDTQEKQARFSREVAYMQKRWSERLVFDPAYNPNLTLEHENFGLAFPPRRVNKVDQKTILSQELPKSASQAAIA